MFLWESKVRNEFQRKAKVIDNDRHQARHGASVTSSGICSTIPAIEPLRRTLGVLLDVGNPEPYRFVSVPQSSTLAILMPSHGSSSSERISVSRSISTFSDKFRYGMSVFSPTAKTSQYTYHERSTSRMRVELKQLEVKGPSRHPRAIADWFLFLCARLHTHRRSLFTHTTGSTNRKETKKLVQRSMSQGILSFRQESRESLVR